MEGGGVRKHTDTHRYRYSCCNLPYNKRKIRKQRKKKVNILNNLFLLNDLLVFLNSMFLLFKNILSSSPSLFLVKLKAGNP